MNDEHHEEKPLQRLSFRERFEVRRAVYGGSAVKDRALAAATVTHARQLKARHRRWSRRWFRSFLLDPVDVPTYVVFSVVLLVVWPSLITVGILVGGFLLIALMTRRRRRRKAEQAEAANQQLL
jgi:Flp pilus assembly protein TadB